MAPPSRALVVFGTVSGLVLPATAAGVDGIAATPSDGLAKPTITSSDSVAKPVLPHGPRFYGLALATAEYRHLVWPKLVSFWGMDLGLGWKAFVDVSRAWESSSGVPFPTDIRPGAGLGVYGTLNRPTIGGYAVSFGNAGFNLIGFLGNSF
ncbi:MAG: hypothetical protein H7338_20095 [Candidatus Sericytochromatia bacterium]|nr:hypothetical protein [Candidatus Sericytochromatia bacterium]